jgi:ribonuclease P protein component
VENELSTKQFKFSKEERLCRQKNIDNLFQHGQSFVAYPIRIIWTMKQLNNIIPGYSVPGKEPTDIENKPPAQLLITVSAKTFKRAVDRNKIKRRLREGYRLHKNPLYEALKGKDFNLDLGCQYIGKEILNYHEIEEKLVLAIRYLIRQLEKTA